MRILQLRAENIKRLVVVEITPDGNIVKISGKNGSGKTSVLDAIWWALDGAKNIQKKPIRDGAESGYIEIDLGEMVVTRTFTGKDSYLKVTNADGAAFSKPQQVLDKLLGKLSFDPLEFLRQKPADQVATLEAIAGVDGAEVREANKADYDTRRDLNRDAKAAKARADAIEVGPEDPGLTEIDVTELHARIASATQVKYEREQRRLKMEELSGRIERGKKAIAELEKEFADLVDAAESAPEPEDIEAMQSEFATAKGVNEAVRRVRERQQHLDEVESLQHQANELTDAMEARTKAFRAAVAASKLPVDGLGLDLDENCVTFNGLPLEQASRAEQTRISTAIAMNANPTIRVIRIQDGSLIGKDELALISKMADDEDYQIWMEVVDETGKVGIMLEDGMVKNVN